VGLELEAGHEGVDVIPVLADLGAGCSEVEVAVVNVCGVSLNY
jgi:hypothetical protein